MNNLKIAFLFSIYIVSYTVSASVSSIKAQSGRFYGKVIDDKSGRGIEAASVQIWQDGYDQVTHEAKPILKGGMLTETNGEFSIDNLPTQGFMILKIFAIGYESIEKKIQFDVAFDKKKGLDIDLGTFDKDLGNIKMKRINEELKEVVVKADEPFMKVGVDRKIYNADKMTVAAGGTATDAMKTIPGVNVDIDGKVTVRNVAPTIYVDGRPTNLTLDQIPANTIQSIEVITNPSAKYDASGKGGGIINIVLKKDKRLGYNGNIVAAIDRRLMTTNVLNFNFREKKINFFIGGAFIRGKSIADGYSNREYNISNAYNPVLKINQTSENILRNTISNFNGGFDWLINIRNTITFSINYSSGIFKLNDIIDIGYDSNTLVIQKSGSTRNSSSDRSFSNIGTSLQYKKLFTKNGKEFTADFYYNGAGSNFGSSSYTSYIDEQGSLYKPDARQKQDGKGGVLFFISQMDYVEPIGKKAKIETGIRSQISSFSSNNTGFIYNNLTNIYDSLKSQTNEYNYVEQIHAAYFTYTKEVKKFNYQLGLRAENYYYEGQLASNPIPFKNNYPIISTQSPYKPYGLFPSIFVSYKINDDQDLQLNSSRRVNRPNFFQLIPYLDFSDSLNLSRGNPGLKPEYSYQTELSYNYTWGQKKSFIANAYFRTANNLITSVRQSEYNAELGRNVIITTYGNANTAMAYGVEMNLQNMAGKKIEMNTNVNIYYSQITGNSLLQTQTIDQTTMFARYYLIYRHSKVLLFQLVADYQSKVSYQPDGVSGGQFFSIGGASNSAQGYQRQSGGIDLGMKYDFTFKREKDPKKAKTASKPGSLILNFTDILHTRRSDIYSSSPFFTQNTFSQRDWRMLRLTLTYRFGKFDTSLLRRKNQNKNSGPQIL